MDVYQALKDLPHGHVKVLHIGLINPLKSGDQLIKFP